MVCDDQNACTGNACDSSLGVCVHTLIDNDGDGEASSQLGACGTDCNDADKTIGQKQQEICGDQKDNDCDPNTIDDTRTQYFLDCDGDSFAAKGAGWVLSCELPSPSGSCGKGLADKWTTRAPDSSAQTDCFDGNPNVRPNQVSFKNTAIPGAPAAVDFDYNCNEVEQPLYTAVKASGHPCTYVSGQCVGTDGWVGAAGPACGFPADFSSCNCAPIRTLQVISAAITQPILGCSGTCTRSTSPMTQSCL